MECFIVNKSDINLAAQTLVLRGEEARHAMRVLRIQEGEQLMTTTLDGMCYLGKYMKSGQPSKNEWLCECSIEEPMPEHNEPRIDIQLIQGITLGQSKLEEVAEKVTEIGVKSIIPIYSRRSEKRIINAARLERIVSTACKQSSRGRAPKLYDVMSFAESMQMAFNENRRIILLHEATSQSNALLKIIEQEKNNKISLVIGPEGGFDEAEVLLACSEFDAQVASLGARRLRAETAAIAAVAIALSFED